MNQSKTVALPHVSDDSSGEWTEEEEQPVKAAKSGVKYILKPTNFNYNRKSPKMMLKNHQDLPVFEIADKVEDKVEDKQVHNEKVEVTQTIKDKVVYELPKPRVVQFLIYEAKITFFENFSRFFIAKTIEKHEEEQLRLFKKMQDYYSDTSKPFASKVFYGFLCAVQDDGIWRRGFVKRVAGEMANVLLVDIGKILSVNKTSIKLLSIQFIKAPEAAAIECCLADIAPKPENDMKYPIKAVKEFNKLINDSRFVLNASFKKIAPEDMPSPVVLYLYPDNGTRINLNAMIVTKMNCALSTGEASTEMIEIDRDSIDKVQVVQQPPKKVVKNTRMEVEMLNIVSPDEFYAALKNHIDDYVKLHSDLQEIGGLKKKYRELKKTPIQDWIIGDHCLVMHSTEANKNLEYFRAVVVEQFQDSRYEVFLIDKGLKVTVNGEQTLGPELQNMPPAAIRMHIPGAAPAYGSEWNLSSLDCFKTTLSCYPSLCISVVGEKNKNDSLPVMIWGLVIEKSALIRQTRLHNIAEHMYFMGFLRSNGFSYQEVQEKVISDKNFGWTNSAVELADEMSLESINEVSKPQKVTFDDLTIETTPHIINEWESNGSEDKFIGIPTNVDENGIIYIHNEKQSKLLENLRTLITSIYSKLPQDDYNVEVKVGQPVILYNAVDLYYYRGQVEALPKGKVQYKVKLIDYGTIEIVKRNAIYSKVIAAQIPIQTKKYRLASVVPLKKDDNEWPSTTLDFIHAMIVDYKAEITIQTKHSNKKGEDIDECFIHVLDSQMSSGKGVKETLIEKQLANERKAGDAWPPMKKIDPQLEKEWDYDEIQRYKQELESKKLEDLLKTFTVPAVVCVSPEEMKDYLKKHQEDLNLDSLRTSSAGCVRRQGIFADSSPEPSAYLLPESKSRIHSKILTPIIRFLDLRQYDVDSFNCRFVKIIDEKIYLRPKIKVLEENKKQMEKHFNDINWEILDRFKHIEKSVTKLCLANKGSGWKRGIIVKILEHDTVKVFLVDSAETEFFKADQVRKLPHNLHSFPRQTLAVVIHGYKANKNVPDLEEIKKLLELILTKAGNFKAVVKGYDAKNYPEVEIYNKDGNLVYQRLIDKHFFSMKP